METLNSSTRVATKKVWQSPVLQELGNIRQFVQVGGANGKSGNLMDGAANCGGEAMNSGPGC